MGLPTPESWQGSEADCCWQRLDCCCWTGNSHYSHSCGAILFTATNAAVAPLSTFWEEAKHFGCAPVFTALRSNFLTSWHACPKTSDSWTSEKVWWGVRSLVDSLRPQTAGGGESRHSSPSGTKQTTSPSGCDTGRWQRVRLQYIKFSSKI